MTPLNKLFSISNISCFNDVDGAILIENVEGGNPSYEYALNGTDFQDENEFIELSDGVYELIAQDANGCQNSEIITFNIPVPLEVSLGNDTLL